MFDLGWSELLLVAAVALIVIGPKDLPVAMRALGRWVGKARAMSRHVRAGFDEMVRQAELEEMEKEWKRHNEAIMASTGPLPDLGAPPGPEPLQVPAADAPAAGPKPDPVGEPPRIAFDQPDPAVPEVRPEPGPESGR